MYKKIELEKQLQELRDDIETLRHAFGYMKFNFQKVVSGFIKVERLVKNIEKVSKD